MIYWEEGYGVSFPNFSEMQDRFETGLKGAILGPKMTFYDPFGCVLGRKQAVFAYNGYVFDPFFD